MSEQENREEFLKQPNVAVLATVGPCGRAHAAPIWYLYENGVFIMSTGRGSQKHRNIEAHPEVTLVVDRRTLPYYAVMIQGTAEIGPPLSQEAQLRMAVRYLGEEMGRGYIAWRLGEDAVTIRLRPRKFIEYGGVVRGKCCKPLAHKDLWCIMFVMLHSAKRIVCRATRGPLSTNYLCPNDLHNSPQKSEAVKAVPHHVVGHQFWLPASATLHPLPRLLFNELNVSSDNLSKFGNVVKKILGGS